MDGLDKKMNQFGSPATSSRRNSVRFKEDLVYIKNQDDKGIMSSSNLSEYDNLSDPTEIIKNVAILEIYSLFILFF